jgi:hypothetical protein
MCIWMISISLSHFEKKYEFLCTMSVETIFEESIIIFSFVVMDWWQSQLRAGRTIAKVAKKTKCQKMNVNIFTTKLGWIASPSW